jgi:hypothetical protein
LPSAAAGVIADAAARSPAPTAPRKTYRKLLAIIAPSVLALVEFISIVFRQPRTRNRMQIRRQKRK